MKTIRGVAAVALVGVFAVTASGCAWVRPLMGGEQGQAAVAADAFPAILPGQLEPIHAAAFTKDQAVFWVTSNGCTDKDDVKPFIHREGKTSTITLRRLEEDRCDRPMSDGVELQWSFEELGLPPGASVAVNNPYMMPQG